MSSDAMARTAAESHVWQLVADAAEDHDMIVAYEDGEGVDLDIARVAEAVVGPFDVEYEHRDGLRRLVLRTGWEVDPAAVAGSAPPRDFAGLLQ